MCVWCAPIAETRGAFLYNAIAEHLQNANEHEENNNNNNKMRREKKTLSCECDVYGCRDSTAYGMKQLYLIIRINEHTTNVMTFGRRR